MKRITLLLGMGMFYVLCCSAAYAADFDKFKDIAHTTMSKVTSGDVKDADIEKLIKMQEELITIGKSAMQEYSKLHPDTSKMMGLIINKADSMASLSLPEIEAQWHEKGYLKSQGVSEAQLEEKSVTGSLMDTVVHPATAIIALREYKKSKDKNLLQQVNDELEEVVHHVERIKM